jgi:hypothetical protein
MGVRHIHRSLQVMDTLCDFCPLDETCRHLSGYVPGTVVYQERRDFIISCTLLRNDRDLCSR